jgi:hypothetical protein
MRVVCRAKTVCPVVQGESAGILAPDRVQTRDKVAIDS